MKIKYLPQRSDHSLSYEFEENIVKVTLDGATDTMDLTDVLEYPLFEQELNLTVLPINPIVSIKTIDGIKYVELLKFHGPNTPESERFGFDWEDVE